MLQIVSGICAILYSNDTGSVSVLRVTYRNEDIRGFRNGSSRVFRKERNFTDFMPVDPLPLVGQGLRDKDRVTGRFIYFTNLRTPRNTETIKGSTESRSQIGANGPRR